MIRSIRFALALFSVILLVGLAGCSGSKGPALVPVKGTLTINGQAADGVTITFSPVDVGKPSASGPVKNGAFELFTGSEGKPGAAPGKYKVVLAESSGSLEAAMAAMKQSKGAKGGPTAKQKVSFPEKFKSADKSDKEVEVKSGADEIKIDISG